MEVVQQPPTARTTPYDGLTFWQKLGYGLGDIYGGGYNIILNFTYLYFLTSVVRINPGLAGVVILISRAYDAVTDPLEGIIADRTRTRWGRRRPYLVAGIPLIFISFFLLYYPVNFDSEMARFAVVVITYLFFSTVVSIVMLNYNALQSEMTLDYNERTTLSSYRIFFSTVSALACAVIPLQIVNNAADVRTGYMIMAATFGVIFALPFIATVAVAREREDFQREPEPLRLRQLFFEPFKMRTFVLVLFMYLFAFVAIDIVTNIIIFYMTYYVGRPDDASFVLGTLLVGQVFSLPFYLWLSRRTSKRVGYIAGALLWMGMMFVSLFIPRDAPAWVIFAFAAIVGLGTGGIVFMIYSMFPDIPDVDELASGERREGMYFALLVFMRKFSGAFAVFLVSQAINLAGYVPPVEVVVDGATQLVDQPQSETFLAMLRLVFALAPVVFLGLGVFFALRYPLTAAVHDRLRDVLAQRRQDADSVPEEDIAELRRLLIGKGKP